MSLKWPDSRCLCLSVSFKRLSLILFMSMLYTSRQSSPHPFCPHVIPSAKRQSCVPHPKFHFSHDTQKRNRRVHRSALIDRQQFDYWDYLNSRRDAMHKMNGTSTQSIKN